MFTFNRDYRDMEQVAAFLPAFTAIKEGEGLFYNDDFKGRIPELAGPCEDTGIYLLQGLYRFRKQAEKVAALVAQGYEHVERLEGTTRFAHVVLYPTSRTNGEWAEYRDARLVPESRERQAEITGNVSAVLPKGKRTHGHLVMGRRVLVKAHA